MRHRLITIIIAFASLFFLGTNCNRFPPSGGGRVEIYVNRPCDVVIAFNSWFDWFIVDGKKRHSRHNAYVRGYPNKKVKDSLPATDYVLEIITASKMIIKGDAEMENQMRMYFELLKTNTGISDFDSVEYRVEPLEQLKVCADVPLFRKEAGASLNDQFEVDGGQYRFFFTSDKMLIEKSEPWGPIDAFLEYRPMAPGFLFLHLLETPPEAPCTVSFTAEVKIAGREPFRATAAPITLLRGTSTPKVLI